MRQSGSALRKLIRSVAAAGFWSGEANGEERFLGTKPELAAPRHRYWDTLLMGPDQWVVHCKKVGRGQQALVYLGRYLYRGVLPEKKIIADRDGMVSFCYQDSKGKRQVRTLPGGEFLWLLLKHVLPRRFRRVRDFGILPANAKRFIQLLQLTLHMRVPPPDPGHCALRFTVIAAGR
jgi:hypothetical protein